MLVALVLLFCLGFSSAVPIDITGELQRFIQFPFTANILKYSRTDNPNGGYVYDVDQSDGQRKYEEAEIKNAGTDDESIAVKGSYSYVGTDGQLYVVGYTADENGFQAEGEHLPNSANAKKKTPKLGLPPGAVSSLTGGLGK